MTPMRARRPTVAAVERRPTRLWSPAQLIALALGGVAIAFGVIALTRTGLDPSHLTRDRDTVLGFGHTPLLGLAEVGFGVLLVLAAGLPIVGRNAMTLIGAATLGLGVVVVEGWWSTRMVRWLDVSDRSGWLFVAVGGFVLVVSCFTPVLTWGGPRVVRRPVEPAAPPADTLTATPPPPPRRPRLRAPWRGRQARREADRERVDATRA
jgi:hypothetical protein